MSILLFIVKYNYEKITNKHINNICFIILFFICLPQEIIHANNSNFNNTKNKIDNEIPKNSSNFSNINNTTLKITNNAIDKIATELNYAKNILYIMVAFEIIIRFYSGYFINALPSKK